MITTSMSLNARYLLLQARRANDPVKNAEVMAFASVLGCEPSSIIAMDILTARPSAGQLRSVDVILIGGSGDYSIVEGGPWLPRAMDTVRKLHAIRKPTFGSCWGFQAIARSLGGKVGTDPVFAEIGDLQLHLSDAGRDDPVLGPMGTPFKAHCGHQDTVLELPAAAEWLAFSERTRYQALRFTDAPMYGTQFHPELRLSDMYMRFERYPEYVERIADIPFADFRRTLTETPECNKVLPRFVQTILG